MSLLLEMFTYPFILRAFAVGILVSLCAALLGVPLVLKRYSMIGDGLSHVSFGALAVAVACGGRFARSGEGEASHFVVDTHLLDLSFGHTDRSHFGSECRPQMAFTQQSASADATCARAGPGTMSPMA